MMCIPRDRGHQATQASCNNPAFVHLSGAWINLSKDILNWLNDNDVKYNFLLAKNLNHFSMVKALSELDSEVSKSIIAVIENS